MEGEWRGSSGHSHTTQGRTSAEPEAAEAEVRIGLTALGDGAGAGTSEMRFTSDGEPLATATAEGGTPRGEGVSEGDFSPALRVGVPVAALEYCCCSCCCCC